MTSTRSRKAINNHGPAQIPGSTETSADQRLRETRPGTRSVTSTRRLTSNYSATIRANVALHLLSTPSSAISDHTKPGKATMVFFYAFNRVRPARPAKCDRSVAARSETLLRDADTRRDRGDREHQASIPGQQAPPKQLSRREWSGRREAPGFARRGRLIPGFLPPPIDPCVRFSRTRLADVLHRRHSAFPVPRPVGSRRDDDSVEVDQP
jgi:hypothetical protein